MGGVGPPIGRVRSRLRNTTASMCADVHHNRSRARGAVRGRKISAPGRPLGTCEQISLVNGIARVRYLFLPGIIEIFPTPQIYELFAVCRKCRGCCRLGIVELLMAPRARFDYVREKSRGYRCVPVFRENVSIHTESCIDKIPKKSFNRKNYYYNCYIRKRSDIFREDF